ncbi:MAG TPA: FliM/FliN family flagellar motor switch protein [Acidobacteriaceae bacterium]|nr:FliM/FliN family flagellar motor switch protein [Acidobacteriaceae bacterium]
MNSTGEWIARLEAEIARELGQRVSIAGGGQLPEAEGSLGTVLELPEARLALAVDPADLSRIFVAGRLIEEDSATAGTVEELWNGILTSVAARLGGRMGTPSGTLSSARAAEPCTLHLADATMRMALLVEAAASVAGPSETAARSATREPGNYDLLLEVELDAQLRFGSREIELQELLELGPGDVVELDRRVSDAVDLIVGDKIVARGEVVLVNGNFGLRVTEVAEPVRRLESIRCVF